MILLDKPYASDYLLDTIARYALPVVDSEAARAVGLAPGAHVLDESGAVIAARAAHEAGRLKLYTNSENALAWVAGNLAFTGVPEMIAPFKDKALFRRVTAPLFPGYFCREVGASELDTVDPGELDFPLVLKPSVGFFSAGVRRVGNRDEWAGALASLRRELEGFAQVYPEQVLDTTRFVIESYIEGREFAIDAYYDDDGEPVLLNLLEHYFSSNDDVGDRVYSTSPELVAEHLDSFTEFLQRMGELVGARDIPVHVELRITADGALFPIEVNPLRFGGWCTTADLTGHAYGFNPYLYYLEGKRPDWDAIFAGREGRTYSLIVLNNSTGREVEDIAGFDREAVAARFTRVMELRPVDHRRFRLFGFVFVETDAKTAAELDFILHSDLTEFLTD